MMTPKQLPVAYWSQGFDTKFWTNFV